MIDDSLHITFMKAKLKYEFQKLKIIKIFKNDIFSF